MEHQTQRPYVYLGGRLVVTLEKLRRHVFEAATIDVLHPYACNRSENPEIDHFYFYAIYVKIATLVIFGWLSEHNILELHVSMDNLAIVAIIYRI